MLNYSLDMQATLRQQLHTYLAYVWDLSFLQDLRRKLFPNERPLCLRYQHDLSYPSHRLTYFNLGVYYSAIIFFNKLRTYSFKRWVGCTDALCHFKKTFQFCLFGLISYPAILYCLTWLPYAPRNFEKNLKCHFCLHYELYLVITVFFK